MLFRLLEQSHIEALVVGSPADWYYLTGFTGESGLLMVSRTGSTLITDGRFTVQAKEETRGVRILLQKGSLFQAAGEYIRAQGFRRVGFEPERISVAGWSELSRAAGRRFKTIRAGGVVVQLRTRKDPAELTQMRKAALLASAVVQSALKLLKPGVRELEVASEIEYEMRRRGASGPAFETIVAFGTRSALPHARPTAKRLKKNELVVLDLGVILGHYCSDITRTVFVGKASERVRSWYRGVQEAQAAAIAASREGVTCGEVDQAARKVLARFKLDRYFVHSTGHGLGLEVHEEPRVAKGQERRLQAGNVITIEPGVYVEGTGGIRIEDDVAIREKRTEVLTRGSRELIEL
ncbi:MAG TPA: Xaa-Pro peptidase family protein [Terriglobales bacterium]|nr:Xaa-Pro peptidase family protein [Terriglobales bacterium]